MVGRVVYGCCLFVLAAVFAYAGFLKVLDPAEFRIAVESFRMVDGFLLSASVYGIPALEVVLAVGLFIPRYRLTAAVLSFLLMVLFTVLILIAWVRGIDLTCGCFGAPASNDTNYPFLLGRDLALIFVAVVVWKGSLVRKPNSQ
ncbi:MAG: MauE/DoxX family redox-associated membrane protein [Verrucomicrobiota bacterium]